MGNRSAIEKEMDGEILAMRIGYVFHHGDLFRFAALFRGAHHEGNPHPSLTATKNSPFGEFFFKGAIRIRS